MQEAVVNILIPITLRPFHLDFDFTADYPTQMSQERSSALNMAILVQFENCQSRGISDRNGDSLELPQTPCNRSESKLLLSN